MFNINELNKYGIDSTSIKKCISTYRNREITVTVTGEFSSGKSSFINALLKRRDLLPYGESECTPVYVDLSVGSYDSMAVINDKGVADEVELNQQNLDKYTRFGASFDTSTVAVNISLKDFPLNKCLHIIDCPGTNTIYSEHEQITKRVLSRSDMVIYTFNKLISAESIKAIEDIYKHNKNIMFVMTHIDEADGRYAYLDDNSINKYMTEARICISQQLGVSPDSLMLFPVGSIKAFEDDRYISCIAEHLNNFAVVCGENAIRMSAERKINTIIEVAVEDQEKELKLLQQASDMEKEKLAEQIETAEKKLSALKNEMAIIRQGITERAEVMSNNTVRKIEEISKKCTNILAARVDRNDLQSLEAEINRVCGRYESDISTEIRNAINKLVTDEYQKASDKLIAAADNLELPVFERFTLEPPCLEDYISDTEVDNKYQSKIMAIDIEMMELNDQKAQRLNCIQDQRDKLNRVEETHFQAIKNRAELGSYTPKMLEIKEEGGGAVGKMIGRVVGEVADIALLFINPAGGAAEGAVKAVQGGAKFLNAADKVKDAAKVAQYATNIVNNVKNSAQVIADQTKGNSGKWLGAISKILDYVSVGHWGEKIGECIGNAVKPEKVHHVEDEQNRAEYMSKIETHNQIIKELQRAIDNEQENIRQLQDMSEISKRSNELRIRKAELEQQMKIASDMQKKLEQTEKQQKIHAYYLETIRSNFDAMTEDNCSYARSIIQTVTELSANAVADDYSEALAKIEEQLELLGKSNEETTAEMNKQKQKLLTFAEIRNSVSEWLDSGYVGEVYA